MCEIIVWFARPNIFESLLQCSGSSSAQFQQLIPLSISKTLAQNISNPFDSLFHQTYCTTLRLVGNGDALGNWNPWEGSVELSTTEKDLLCCVDWSDFSFFFLLPVLFVSLKPCNRTIHFGSRPQLSSPRAQSTNMCLGCPSAPQSHLSIQMQIQMLQTNWQEQTLTESLDPPKANKPFLYLLQLLPRLIPYRIIVHVILAWDSSLEHDFCNVESLKEWLTETSLVHVAPVNLKWGFPSSRSKKSQKQNFCSRVSLFTLPSLLRFDWKEMAMWLGHLGLIWQLSAREYERMESK